MTARTQKNQLELRKSSATGTSALLRPRGHDRSRCGSGSCECRARGSGSSSGVMGCRWWFVAVLLVGGCR